MKQKFFSISIFLLGCILIQYLSISNWGTYKSGITRLNHESNFFNFQNSNLKQDLDNYVYLPVILNGKEAYYVSSNGSDSNPGTLQLPWRTINKAARSVVPGDVVYIRGGVYREYVSINRSGNQAQPIKFIAYQGETPVIDGTNIDTNNDGLLTLDGDWIEVTGLDVGNSTYVGISSYGKHNTLTNVYVHHSFRSGIYLSGDYGVVQDSRIWRNSLKNEFGASSGSSGIVSSNDEFDNGISDYTIIRRNKVWENWGQGINIHHSQNTTVEDNIIFDSYGANIYIHDTTKATCQRNFVFMDLSNTYMNNYGPKVGLMMGQEWINPIINVKDIFVINNIFYGNHRNLFWYTGDINGAGMTNVLFANNTFINGSGGSSGGNANIILDKGVNSNVRFINNIVHQDNDLPLISIEDFSGLTHSYNLWSKNPGFSLTTGEIIGDPKLAKIGSPFNSGWYELTIPSPAKDKATLLIEVTVDFLSRFRGQKPDIGAMELLP